MTRRLPALLVLVLGALLALVWMAGAPPEERVPEAPVKSAAPEVEPVQAAPRVPRGSREPAAEPASTEGDGEPEPAQSPSPIREVRTNVVAAGLPGRVHAVVLLTSSGAEQSAWWDGAAYTARAHLPDGVLRAEVRPFGGAGAGGPLVSGRIAPEQDEITVTVPAACVVAGRVIDQNGAAVPNAPIQYRSIALIQTRSVGDPQSVEEEVRTGAGSVQTDASGRFVIAVPRGSDCTLDAFEGRIRSELATSATVTADAGDTDVVIRIRWRPRIQLTVLDAAEQPVQNLQLRATWVGGPETAGEGRTSVAARSHTNGRVDFRDLREGRYAIDLAPEKAARKGYSAIESLTVETGRDDAVLRVRKGLSIRGAVVDSSGKPVEDAEIEAHPADASRVELTTVYAISAADGTFELVGLAPGVVYELRAMSQEGTAGLLTEQSSGTTNARIELGERVAMRGRVDRRYAGVRVELEHTDTGERLSGTVRSNGAVDLLGLRPGRHRVRVWRPGEDRARAELAEIEARPAGRLALDLEQAFGE